MKKKAVIIFLIGVITAVLSFLITPVFSSILGSDSGITHVQGVVFAAGLLLIGIGAGLLLRTGEKKDLLPAGASYEKKSRFLSGPEQELFYVLEDVLGDKYAVFPQPALISVIQKKSGGGFNSELFRVADFVIVDAATTEPLLLIELNDKSHLRSDRAERDAKVAAICENADIDVLTVDIQDRLDASFIKKQLKRYLK